VPAGWLVCDGRPLRSLEYQELWKAIGTSYGAGYWPSGAGGLVVGDGHDFNLPDLRGRFLRGAETAASDGSYAGADPDAAGRERLYLGGVTGAAVGSYQNDATRRPNTTFKSNSMGDHGNHWRGNVGESPMGNGPIGASPHIHNAAGPNVGGAHVHEISDGGDAETRPKNVAMLWIIRAKP
jgi:hypothetical protein